MLTFAESRHPIHESIEQRWWKIVIHYCADLGTIATVFRTIISVNQLIPEQSQKCVKNVILAIIIQGDLLWKDNASHCSCQV